MGKRHSYNDGLKQTVFANTFEPRPVSKKKWIVVGTDKLGKSYTLTYPNGEWNSCSRIEAKVIFEETARLQGLKLSKIQTI